MTMGDCGYEKRVVLFYYVSCINRNINLKGRSEVSKNEYFTRLWVWCTTITLNFNIRKIPKSLLWKQYVCCIIVCAVKLVGTVKPQI